MTSTKTAKPRLVVLSGAGMSAESGISTFRDANGLWENHSIEEVATYEAWLRNPNLVLQFYNQRRRQLKEVIPNAAHLFLAKMESTYDVHIITQNVDDLHERAGSTKVLHLHGELLKVRSDKNQNLVYHWPDDLQLGDRAEDRSQLRPHIVWFGEEVPLLPMAAEWVSQANVLLIIGTSMQVYPAATLYEYAPHDCPLYIVNPTETYFQSPHPKVYIAKTAVQAIDELQNLLKP